MLIPEEHLPTLRRLIHRQYLHSSSIALAFSGIGIIVYLFFKGNLLINAMAIQLAWLGLAFAWYMYDHRKHLQSLLTTNKEIQIESIEAYILGCKEKWDSRYPVLLLAGILIAVGFFYFLFLHRNDTIAQVFGALLISYLLAMILKSWLDFHEKILLQDIRHLINHHSS